MSRRSSRPASHAGSWYSASAKELTSQLNKWLDGAGPRIGTARAIISPHAGYSYSGEVAGHAFKQIDPNTVDRVIILGPSHVVSLHGCAITSCDKYKSPIGDVAVDTRVNEELLATRQFEVMDKNYEETEHSIEMQIPFLVRVMEGKPFKIVPILVGNLRDNATKISYGKIFGALMENPRNIFVVSSDFCHWGNRFDYCHHSSSNGMPIYDQIAHLDREGMNAIETLNPHVFSEYLKKTRNTICGRNPITIMLHAADHFRLINNHTHEFRFIKYAQSNKVRSLGDSSVSYAAGALFVHPK
ncbi:unnamed protein product [Auanema sp. JU1783]|nr:unnamed protein product [Auanema sp. JU1783]